MPSDHLANANSWGLSSLELSRPFWLLKKAARGILLSAVVFFLLTHLLSCLLRPVTLNPPRKTYLTPGEVSLFYLLTLQRSSEVDWNHSVLSGPGMVTWKMAGAPEPSFLSSLFPLNAYHHSYWHWSLCYIYDHVSGRQCFSLQQ